MTKAQKLRDQSPVELTGTLKDLSKELYTLRSELQVAKKCEQPHLLRELKKDRARILTVLREKAMNSGGDV